MASPFYLIICFVISRMKIAFFSQNLANYISGGRQYPWHMAHCLANAGHEVLLVTNGEALFDRDYVNFPGRQRVSIYRDLNWGTKDNNFMVKLKSYDLFMCSPMASMDVGVAIAKNYGKKVIGLVYETQPMVEDALANGFELPIIQENILNDFVKQVHRTDMILVNNKYVQNQTKEWLPNYRGKIEPLFNGFNTQIADQVPIIPYKKRNDSVVFLSRAVKAKGFGDLLLTFTKTKIKPKIEFIVGFIDMKQPIIQKFLEACKEYKLDLEIHNRISELDKFKILARSKCLFFPSRFEGFGIPPAEAFYMKTPVVCYDMPVLCEAYKDYPHYLPSFEFDSAAALFDDLWENEDLLFSRCEDAKKYVTSFASVENYTDNINKIICRLMGQPFVPIERKEAKVTKIIEEVKPVTPVQLQVKKGIVCVSPKDIYKDSKLETAEIIVVRDPDVKLNSDFEGEMLYRFNEQKCDFMTFNHRIGDKDINIAGCDLEMIMMKPKCYGGVIAIRSGYFDGDTLQSDFWELETRLKYKENKWYHSRKYSFKITEQKHPEIKFARRIVRNWLEDNDYDDLLEYKILNEKTLVPSFIGDERFKDYPKTLVIIPARTNRYLPKLLEKAQTGNYVYVLCHHCPNGVEDQEVLKTWNLFKDREKHYMKVEGKFNFSKMNNIAYKKYGKDCQYVILCNDDIELEWDTLYNLIRTFKYRFNDLGIVGAKLIYPKTDETTRIQHAGVSLLKDKRCIHKFHKFPANKLCVNYLRKVQAVTFGLVAIDAECYESVMLKDNYPNDLNDIDFCIRAAQKGWDIVYNPMAEAVHHETVTRKEFKMLDDWAARQQFKKDHKDILQHQMSVHELYSWQKHML